MVESATIEDRSRLPWLARRLGEVEAENRRLRNLLKITGGVEPPPEQTMLTPTDPGLVTNASPPDAKLAFYSRLFAARRDVYAYRWENLRKGTKGWSPAAGSIRQAAVVGTGPEASYERRACPPP